MYCTLKCWKYRTLTLANKYYDQKRNQNYFSVMLYEYPSDLMVVLMVLWSHLCCSAADVACWRFYCSRCIMQVHLSWFISVIWHQTCNKVFHGHAPVTNLSCMVCWPGYLIQIIGASCLYFVFTWHLFHLDNQVRRNCCPCMWVTEYTSWSPTRPQLAHILYDHMPLFVTQRSIRICMIEY